MTRASGSAGTPRSFVDGLVASAEAHDAVVHPFLTRLVRDTLPDTLRGLTHFAFQYREFSRYYPRIISSVVRRLHSEEHRAVFQSLSDRINGLSVHGLSHAELFTRFQHGVGVDADYRSAHRIVPEVETWANETFRLCNRPGGIEGVGAVGIAGEIIQPLIFDQIIQAIGRVPSIDEEVSDYFIGMKAVSLEHREAILDVASDLARSEQGRQKLQDAMVASLNLRARFWRAMLMISLVAGHRDVRHTAV